MELSDNPHPVGTTEHHRWVVDVYIPSLDDDQREQHRKRAGAEAIGRELIDGTLSAGSHYATGGIVSGSSHLWLNGKPLPTKSITIDFDTTGFQRACNQILGSTWPTAEQVAGLLDVDPDATGTPPWGWSAEDIVTIDVEETE